jgi:phospholipid/cholesterol/gamma-HCH transport system substrate-binding protein
MKNEIKVALTILSAIVVAFFGYRFMADIPIFSSTYQLHAHYDRVDGIIPGSSVFMQGVKIGTVNSLSFTQTDSIRVLFTVNAPGKIPVGSVAVIRSTGLLEKGIEIQRSGEQIRLESGSRLKGIYDDGFLGALEDIGAQAGPQIARSTESLGNLLEQIDEMLEQGGRQNIEESLSGLNSLISGMEALLREKNDEIGATVTHLRKTMENVEGLTGGHEATIDSLLTSLQISSERIEILTDEMNRAGKSLNSILAKIDEGEGSLGLLINDPSLYRNLDSLSYNLSKLVKELNDNPRHFLKHVRLIDIF